MKQRFATATTALAAMIAWSLVALAAQSTEADLKKQRTANAKTTDEKKSVAKPAPAKTTSKTIATSKSKSITKPPGSKPQPVLTASLAKSTTVPKPPAAKAATTPKPGPDARSIPAFAVTSVKRSCPSL